MIRKLCVGLLICVLAAMAAPVRAAGPLLQEAIGLMGPAIWLSSGAPGLVLGVVDGNETIVAGYGHVRPPSEHSEQPNPEPDGRTLFRLGSVSKAFAGELLASLVAEGRVRLTDPLRQFLPADITVPKSGERAITLLDLATHSAGLPREMGYAPDGTPPFTWPTRPVRFAWLKKQSLDWTPGSVAAYSNIGFDLLGDALEGAARQPYAMLLRERITAPLGMADTTLTPDASQCAPLMQGTGIGAPSEPVCTDTQATQASGGLYSTADDMVKWLRHQLDTGNPEVWPTLMVSHAIYRQRQSMPAAIGFDEGAPMAGLALAWVMRAAHGGTPMILDKSGGGGGFMTYVAFAPGRRVGVFVAVDRVDFGMFLGLVNAADELLASLTTR
jgi:D-alanyl-D-alanine-carboxypeptidase/D-alanyl-D-alanine-endopeptidase